MISIFDKNNKLNEHRNSLDITYPRRINIIFGHYPYPDILHNLIISVKNNIKEDMKNYTNVHGGMTDWKHFIGNPLFENFFTYLINKHQTTHPHIFEYFLEKNIVLDSWGNEIKKGDSLKPHHHPCYHGILYMTKGCDLILPELNIKITPSPGDYYIFPPHIMHGFDEVTDEETRYSLIFNIVEHQHFEFKRRINGRKNI